MGTDRTGESGAFSGTSEPLVGTEPAAWKQGAFSGTGEPLVGTFQRPSRLRRLTVTEWCETPVAVEA